MLDHLHITNFALIDDIEVEFTPGLNVLTGETGAGKSIIVEALKLALGHRARSETVRSGTRQARIEALFRDVDHPEVARILDETGLDGSTDELLLARIVQAEGRSRCYVNGHMCSAQTVLSIGMALVDFHGQHEHQSLLDQSRQRLMLDGFAGLDELRGRVADVYARWRTAKQQLAGLHTDERERLRRIDILRHEVDEIRDANLQPGEEDQLKSCRDIVANAEKLYTLAEHARSVLETESAAVSLADLWAELSSDVDQLASIDPQFADTRDFLKSTQIEFAELGYRLQRYSDEVHFDPNELAAIDDRLAVIRQIKRKYGDTIESVLDYAERSEAELVELDTHDERVASLESECASLKAEALEVADRLSARRSSIAKRLASQTVKELRPLAMDRARLDVVVSRQPDDSLGPTGLDDIEIVFSANKGEQMGPLRAIASGGELSRVMLALKVVLARSDRTGTLVFDEVDAGVGRTVAGRIAEKLGDAARHHQLLCITHLPQIAAAADNHICVDKRQVGGRTVTCAETIDSDNRVREVAKLIGGTDGTKLSIDHAREMIRQIRTGR